MPTLTTSGEKGGDDGGGVGGDDSVDNGPTPWLLTTSPSESSGGTPTLTTSGEKGGVMLRVVGVMIVLITAQHRCY